MTAPRLFPSAKLSGVDNAFLRIEEDNHLMTVASCWKFDARVEQSEVLTSLKQLVDRFPRFTQRAIPFSKVTGEMIWDNYDFDLNDHLHLEVLADSDNCDQPEQLRKRLGELMSQKLEISKALWMANIIYYGPNKSAILIRVHHCLTDGQGGIRALLSLTAESNDSELQYAQKSPRKETSVDSSTSSSTVPQSHIQKIKNLFTESAKLLIKFICYILFLVWGLVMVQCNLFYLLIFWRKKNFVGTMTTSKSVAYVDDVDLNDVKTIKDKLGVTVNDVLISALAGSFHEYLKSSNNLQDKELLTCIPISMRAADDWELGNKVSVVWAWLPLHIEDPQARLHEVHERMNKMKSSLEPVAAYLWARWLGNSVLANLPITNWWIKQILNKPHTVFTNVPGPRKPITFAGQQIQSYVPLIPQPGEGGLGVALLSYADRVSCSILTDEALLPDQGIAITEGFRNQIQILLQSCA